MEPLKKVSKDFKVKPVYTDIQQPQLEQAIDNSITKMVENGKLIRVTGLVNGEVRTRYIKP